MMEGLVVLLEANRPTVVVPDGTTYLCYLKGRIKRDVGRILVGDRVWIEPTDPGEARIEAVLPRENHLVRPPVANVAGLFMVFSLQSPAGSLELLDKRLVMAQLQGLRAELILSKVDLVEDQDRLEEVSSVYAQAGYPVWRIAVPPGLGLEGVMHQPRQGVWVLSGESGAGKSTLLKAMIPTAEASAGELSRIGRGQQTTRWVRLYAIDNYWLADSPGYTAMETAVDSPYAIEESFPEFDQFRCRFSDCLHREEPGCQVKAAKDSGEVAEWRYHHYLLLLSEWVKSY